MVVLQNSFFRPTRQKFRNSRILKKSKIPEFRKSYRKNTESRPLLYVSSSMVKCTHRWPAHTRTVPTLSVPNACHLDMIDTEGGCRAHPSSGRWLRTETGDEYCAIQLVSILFVKNTAVNDVIAADVATVNTVVRETSAPAQCAHQTAVPGESEPARF